MKCHKNIVILIVAGIGIAASVDTSLANGPQRAPASRIITQHAVELMPCTSALPEPPSGKQPIAQNVKPTVRSQGAAVTALEISAVLVANVLAPLWNGAAFVAAERYRLRAISPPTNAALLARGDKLQDEVDELEVTLRLRTGSFVPVPMLRDSYNRELTQKLADFVFRPVPFSRDTNNRGQFKEIELQLAGIELRLSLLKFVLHFEPWGHSTKWTGYYPRFSNWPDPVPLAPDLKAAQQRIDNLSLRRDELKAQFAESKK